MIDRVEIATRHGLAPEIGPLLHGTTRDQLEADAAARAAVAAILDRPKPSGALVEHLHRGDGDE